MAYKIYDDGVVIRIENGTSVLFVSKAQVKTIDTIANGVVRLDIGEGPLKNVFLRYSEVEVPAVTSGEQLRDAIKNMMPNLTEEAGILNELTNIKNLLNTLKDTEADLLKTEPTRIDESQPNAVYKGWHKGSGAATAPEWAILKITQTADNILYEWADGSTRQTNIWNERYNLTYRPLNYIVSMEAIS
ncbi:hypothetical protein [Longitalea luteola]|uniref:hypothetical protein n=1 Tax=Longitalea luteola TaxID=2812563 RepID=UPI001A960E43|nr:hypothetical protein [Longitalea luteola]